MTVVVGLVHDGAVWIGADSAGVAGWDLRVRADPKVFRVGAFLMGFTTSFRMGQLLRYSLVPPQHADGIASHRYMATVFVDAVRECLKAGGYASKDKEQETGGCFLVGYRGELFVIRSDYQVEQPSDSYAAIGCGDQVAHGAVFALHDRGPETRMRVALEAAERFSSGVRRPFVVEHIP